MRGVVRLVRLVFGKDAAKGGFLTMTAPTAKPRIARAVFFWFSIIFLGFMLWRLLAMPPNPLINHPVAVIIGVAPLVLVCGLGLWIRRKRRRQKE
jgi:hypothetical protein